MLKNLGGSSHPPFVQEGLRPIHMVQSVAYNSFLLLCSNHRVDLQISEYNKSYVQLIISCEWVFSGSCD